MLGLPLAFAVPGVLAALAALPVLYWLLRLTPPRPRTMPLPSLHRLGLVAEDGTPARTPPWLLVLRLALAAAIVLAMAGPVWNPLAPGPSGRGPLLAILDDGFSAAPDWDARIGFLRERLESAERGGRIVAVVASSDGARAVETVSPGLTAERLRARKPVPVEPDRLALLPAVEGFVARHPDTELVWVADGVERGGGRSFAQALTRFGTTLQVVTGRSVPLALAGVLNTPDSLQARVLRPSPDGPASGIVQALDAKGLPVAEASFALGAAPEGSARFVLPVELRNAVARVAIAGVPSAGAVALLDGRSKRRRVGIVTGATADLAQPLLSPAYYVRKALAPVATVLEPRVGSAEPVAAVLDDKPGVLVLADVGAVTGAPHERVARFLAEGGVVVRFAGPRLAAANDDGLLPVVLRRGGRTFGGALSWDTPKPLAPFDAAGPLAGLTAPAEVTVSRQVLAEPDSGLTGKTWAHLTDGTPLVTAEKRGKGMLVLVHVTADTTWSNLPLSGLFVDLLQRLVDLAPAGEGGAAAAGPARDEAVLGPLRTLDGFGVMGPPPASARPVPAGFAGTGTQDHPPGLYGTPDAPLAVNALGGADMLAPLDLSGLPVDRQELRTAEPLDLRAPLVTLAVLLLLGDAIATLILGGGVPGWRRGAAAACLAALALLAPGAGRPFAFAQDAGPTVQARERDAALTTRLGYVQTGDAAVDETSRLGLLSLSHALADRTSLTPGEPAGLDPARDDLSFYPLIYWPVVAGAPQPAPAAVDRISAYMKNGGTVVFDTRDALTSRPDGAPTAEARWLQTMLAGVDVPALEPVPSDHVVTKTFYLLTGFVGRYASAQTWVEALPPASRDDPTRPVRAGDSVSPIVITGNDLAGAWAATPDGDPLYPLVPGGPRQRELALRGGVNLVMYTLTGNYKADQVHVRDLLERLAH